MTILDQSPATPILRLDGVHLSYRQGGRELHVLRGASAEARRGESIALLGPSGAGKSSLLHVIGLLEQPRAGEVVIDGTACAALNDAARTRLRRATLGFVYQFHHLLPEFSALENVMLPQLIRGAERTAAARRAEELLRSLGLEDRCDHRPPQLSGGEQQRVALARAVANHPKLLLADEPTGNLDPETAERVFQELMELVRKEGVTVVVATHNLDLARRMDRVWRLREGQIVEVAPANV